jgi:hypothetical protein
MKRYELNERGRLIWIEIPVVTVAVVFTCTNALELVVRWIYGY